MVDRAVVNGADEATLTDVKKDWISIPVKESIEKNGKEPGLFASIMQRAINHLRNLLEYMREVGAKSAEEKVEKRAVLGTTVPDKKVIVAPPRPITDKEEAEVARLKEGYGLLKKAERKVAALERAVIKLEADYQATFKETFGFRERKKIQVSLNYKKADLLKVQSELSMLPVKYGFDNALDLKKALGSAKSKLTQKQKEQNEWDAIYASYDTKLISGPVEETKKSVLAQIKENKELIAKESPRENRHTKEETR